MIEIINDSILNSDEKYIAHNCNCITQKSAGTAKSIFDQFTYSNTYQNRTSPSKQGTIEILGNGINQRYIINMYVQYYPGKPKYDNFDGSRPREKYFHSCLLQVAKIENLTSIAFPYGIGCNLGGGNWDYYYGTLINFEKFVNNKFGTTVKIYKKDK
jgi:O-acetyl-ADP-ribose deacetylase (regulator of RNase III)